MILLEQVSGYCPLHLFSGDDERMAAALRALLITPHNNLSIRRNGMLVFGHAGDIDCNSDMDGVTEHDALPSALHGLGTSEMSGHARTELLVALLVRILQCSGALTRLLTVQKLDAHDIEGTYTVRISAASTYQL